ncbi:MAG: hypothetical protein BSOLF_1722 [Candidatus Carbobacillus altaicus]|uniref:Uncharacterized protein n=1 Tax=Candidatus Carbonibacillus altaicus TaxID=2163959 RepID=A0A2R6XZ11_9BACL|nr:MAG: hypothetical protein BSOLF_1722 [Candidatus Carbobacillus altaicus]
MGNTPFPFAGNEGGGNKKPLRLTEGQSGGRGIILPDRGDNW